MGSNEVPKNLVMEALPKLAQVISKFLFESEIDNKGDLVVYQNSNKRNEPLLLNNNQKKGIVTYKNHEEQELH